METRQDKNKLSISVSQAFLLLLETHRHNPEKYKELCELYLIGRNPENAERFDSWLNDKKITTKYFIDRSFEKAESDATRRYFETHLALHTRNEVINDMDLAKLQRHLQNLYLLLPYEDFRNKIIAMINLEKEFVYKASPTGVDIFFEETRDTLEKIERDKILSELNKNKLQFVAASAVLGWAAVFLHPEKYPINIYREIEEYTEQYRGRVTKKQDTRSQLNGIMKSYMPVSRDDIIFNDTPFQYSKPTDLYKYVPDSGWVRHVAETGVDTFVSSISATMLSELCTMKHLANKGKLVFITTADMHNFLKCMISTMLATNGGHTIREFVAPLRFPAVRESYLFIPGFNNIDEKSLFLDSNQKAFDAAVDESIVYNNALLKRSAIHQELTRENSPQKKLKKRSVIPDLKKYFARAVSYLDDSIGDQYKNLMVNINNVPDDDVANFKIAVKKVTATIQEQLKKITASLNNCERYALQKPNDQYLSAQLKELSSIVDQLVSLKILFDDKINELQKPNDVTPVSMFSIPKANVRPSSHEALKLRLLQYNISESDIAKFFDPHKRKKVEIDNLIDLLCVGSSTKLQKYVKDTINNDTDVSKNAKPR